MDSTTLIDKIIDKEWNMFHNVNGNSRVDCQEDRVTFDAMRRAQFTAWSPAAVASYLQDLECAEREGRNLLREKYIWMMQHTDPAAFEVLCSELPCPSDKKLELVSQLCARFLVQTERMREKYPSVALGGRPLRATDENGWASIETYLAGELMTYSEQTLTALSEHLLALESKGVDLAFEIQKNTILSMGFSSMEEAENAAKH